MSRDLQTVSFVVQEGLGDPQCNLLWSPKKNISGTVFAPWPAGSWTQARPKVRKCWLWQDHVHGHLLLCTEQSSIASGSKAVGNVRVIACTAVVSNYCTLPSSMFLEPARSVRKHFHEFLYEIQCLLHRIKKEDGEVSTREPSDC